MLHRKWRPKPPPSGFDRSGRSRLPSKRQLKCRLAAGEARAVGLLCSDAGEAANAPAIYECEGWLCNLQGDCFEIGADGKVRPYGQENVAGRVLLPQDEAKPLDRSESKPSATWLELAIVLGVGRRALAPSVVEAIVARYGNLEAIRIELDRLSSEIRPEDRWRPAGFGQEEFRKRKARQDELLAVERLLRPPPDASQSLSSATSTSASRVELGAHFGVQMPRRTFFRTVGDRLAMDAGVVVVGGSLGLFGLGAYTLQVAALSGKREATEQSKRVRTDVREVWLPPQLYELMENTNQSDSRLQSERSMFDYLVINHFQESWFVITVDELMRLTSGEVIYTQTVVCRPGWSVQHANFLRFIIHAKKGMPLPTPSPLSYGFSSIEAFHKIPSEWASKSADAIFTLFNQLAEKHRLGDGFDRFRASSPASIFELSPEELGDLGKP